MGDDTLYSGTVAAAMEGYLFGIPAVAFSQVERGWEHLECGFPHRAPHPRVAAAAGHRPGIRGCSMSTSRITPNPTPSTGASRASVGAMRASR